MNVQSGTVKHIVLNSQNTDDFTRQRLWVSIEKTTVDIRIKSIKDLSPVIKRTQFPLMLVQACTVYKVQGLRLSEIVVNFQLLKQRNFNYGQIYVALSRVTSLPLKSPSL